MANVHVSRPADVSPSAQRPMAISMTCIRNEIQQKIRSKNKDSTVLNSFHSFTTILEFYGKMFYLNQGESHNTCLIFVYIELYIDQCFKSNMWLLLICAYHSQKYMQGHHIISSHQHLCSVQHG